MNARIEAAAWEIYKANHPNHASPGLSGVGGPIRAYCMDIATASITAADAVMFSDEAIERAAKAEHACDWHGVNVPSWENEDAHVKDNYRAGIRVIIAALKGDA